MPHHTTPNRRIYLDHNATALLTAEVRLAMMDAMIVSGNPSSPHAEGRSARKVVELARGQIANAISAASLDVIFCSGGTEANHLGLLGLARAAPASQRRLLIPKTVHPSLWAAAETLVSESYVLTELPVDSAGSILIPEAQKIAEEGQVAVLAFSVANHELGTIENVVALTTLARSIGCYVFCDAVQALGRIPISVNDLGVDGLSISGHKIGGPKGIGALWVKPGLNLQPLIGGGKQESGRRPGTQAVTAISGFGAAVAALGNRLEDRDRQHVLSHHLSKGLADLGAQLLSSESGICNTVCARFADIPGDLLVSSLDLAGIAISTGAACSSGTNLPSDVLLAIGLTKQEALECIRISIGPETLRKDLDALLELLPAIIMRARCFS